MFDCPHEFHSNPAWYILICSIWSSHRYTPQDIVVGNAVMVLKSLVQSQLSSSNSFPQASSPSKAPLRIVESLAYKIGEVRHPSARACILWLVGQYASKVEGEGGAFMKIEGVADWAPDTLRKVAKTFMQEVDVPQDQLNRMLICLHFFSHPLSNYKQSH